MSSDIAIQVTGLTKQHAIFDKPHDRLKQFLCMGKKKYYREFSALNDISFTLLKGEMLGVIGENGAGKSTLLELICGTLNPSAGHVEVKGRVAALLELGSGFNPEFTGRENVYMSAAIIGLSKQEIDERFDDIAAFADIGGFIDQPVKTYSSGMHVRLAFSTATSVDPDILIIDEALSVGDIQFQKKCINRMMHFRDVGKTILFCSHSMYHVQELCSKALWLHKGQMRRLGPVNEVVSEYMAESENVANMAASDEAKNPVNETSNAPDVTIKEIFVTDADGNILSKAQQFQTIVIHVKTRRQGAPLKGHIAAGLIKRDGQIMFVTTTKNVGLPPIVFTGEQHIKIHIPSLPLTSGMFCARATTVDASGFLLAGRDVKISEYFLVTGQQTEMGVIWMNHKWEVS